ncbi:MULTISPECIES: isochorismate synthase MenF [Haloferax]|uniref:isochorismate synthase n=1 Tax=Haloferax marinum TaxID=2666143 RepID=A0A6A8G400_9EURY|nr:MULTISPECIES: isochorismate synthase [Haloferax]KAB1196312.1 isochorismate synthase [Haloferax sp. CBA1150]MRW95302.1 isochorismate synthase [Haloferax marinum]
MEPLRTDEVATHLVSRSVRLPSPPVTASLAAVRRPRTLWTAPDEPTVVGGGAAVTVEADGPGRLREVRESASALLETADVEGPTVARPRFFGGFAFHEDATGRGPWADFPAARFVVPEVQLVFDDDEAWVTVTAVDTTPETVEDRLDAVREMLQNFEEAPPEGPPGVSKRHRTTSIDAWRESVETAVSRIRSGELRKVVLAQALEVELDQPASVPDLLARLGETYPDCHRFLVEPAMGASFLGATPERLVSLRGREVSTGALAGTTGRGDTDDEDEWLAEELLASEKDNHEHELVAETIREQLDPLSAEIRVGDRGVRKLATVQHLWTPIDATLEHDEHVLSLVEALHPTPAVGGLPPKAALDVIRDTEPFDRGWYAAPVGWFDADGDGSFAVAIRSATVEGTMATLFAGVGLVADSDPDAEWDEVQLKYRPILDELERDD